MLFLSDLDGTLHGTSSDALQALAVWTAFWQSSEVMSAGSILCYNTGRCITDYMSTLQPDLPVPDVLITGDGTEIRWLKKGHLVHDGGATVEHFDVDEQWAASVETCWHAARDRVVATMDRDDEGHIEKLNEVSNSPPRGEARWAITVLGEERAHARCAAYNAEFAADGIGFYVMAGWGEPACHLVVAIPAACGKLNAARHVQRRLGFADGACVAAGDSENDLPMVRGGYGFIMVGNAIGALVDALDAAARPDLHYRSRGTHASGVMEGLAHFRQRMEEEAAADARVR